VACYAARLESQLGHGLVAQRRREDGMRGPLQRARAGAVTTRRPRAGRRGGALAGGTTLARQWQGVTEDLERATGEVPGKKERAGAHRNGGSTARRRKRRRMVVFNSGGVAPVVVDEGGWVL
jgi:hypothetical protein